MQYTRREILAQELEPMHLEEMVDNMMQLNFSHSCLVF
jgi:hypothetical protein